MFAGAVHKARLLDEKRRRAFAFYNGQAVAPIDGKLEFTQLVRELGYLAPVSVLVPPGRVTPSSADAVRQLDTLAPARFCKPLSGAMGRGIHVATSPDDAIRFLKRKRSPYLVQSVMPPTQGEVRFILHRTVSDLQAGSAPSVIIAYEKLGPSVIGHGYRRWTKIARRVCWRDPEGRRWCYRRLLEPTELTELTSFMLQFLSDLERRLGGPLAVLCADIGITEQGFVFYEAQLPFGKPYRWMRMSDRKAANQMVLDSLVLSGLSLNRQL
jgi:hypothetical protein